MVELCIVLMDNKSKIDIAFKPVFVPISFPTNVTFVSNLDKEIFLFYTCLAALTRATFTVFDTRAQRRTR
jgi:hypothetical protein